MATRGPEELVHRFVHMAELAGPLGREPVRHGRFARRRCRIGGSARTRTEVQGAASHQAACHLFVLLLYRSLPLQICGLANYMPHLVLRHMLSADWAAHALPDKVGGNDVGAKARGAKKMATLWPKEVVAGVILLAEATWLSTRNGRLIRVPREWLSRARGSHGRRTAPLIRSIREALGRGTGRSDRRSNLLRHRDGLDVQDVGSRRLFEAVHDGRHPTAVRSTMILHRSADREALCRLPLGAR